ncbi:MAG: thioredoxin domain-containing protein, partial [Nitrospinota bacterium]
SYDPEYGGFEDKMKFPRPVNFSFLLQFYKNSGNEKALEMVLNTLRNMGKGGLFDQLGGGFHRYSTDPLWRVPHFEKMLYDQAQLVLSYIDGYLITKEEFFKAVATKTLGYVIREMKAPDGGFYSAQDAESAEDPEKPDEKEEGRFYLWRLADVKKILGLPEGEIFSSHFGLKKNGNAPEDPQRVFTGLNVLYQAQNISETASKFNVSELQVREVIQKGSDTLFQARKKRLPPYLDDKILLGWNGLMISAMARGYQVFQKEEYLQVAKEAAGFLSEKLYDSEKKVLLRRYRKGEARFEAHLQDYAFFVQGLIDLYEASFDISWLELAITLTKNQARLFYDSENGGFFETTGTDPSIIYRMKDAYDGAEPTGNSVAVLNLLRLYQVTLDEKFKKMATASLELFGAEVKASPQSLPLLLYAYAFSLNKPKQIIIAGKKGGKETEKMLAEVFSHYIPNKVVLLADGAKGQTRLSERNPFISKLVMKEGRPTAYVCENFTCDYPVTNAGELAALLKK